MDENLIRTLSSAGVAVRQFHPPHWSHVGRLNNRTHRKLLIVDGRIGFTGGVGVAPEWTGHARDPARWRDTRFEVEGLVVAQMQSLFIDNWGKVMPAVDTKLDPAAGRTNGSMNPPLESSAMPPPGQNNGPLGGADARKALQRAVDVDPRDRPSPAPPCRPWADVSAIRRRWTGTFRLRTTRFTDEDRNAVQRRSCPRRQVDRQHPVAMLAHVEADGALASRPMAVLQMDADGALWFFTDLRSSKVEHLRVVNLGFADIPHGTCVSMSGRGEIDTDRGRIERLWTAFAKPWFADGPDSPNLALLKFLPDTADYWDAPNNKMVRAFWSDRVDDGGRQTDLDGRTWLALRVAFGCTLGRCPVI